MDKRKLAEVTVQRIILEISKHECLGSFGSVDIISTSCVEGTPHIFFTLNIVSGSINYIYISHSTV
jgi:hypothetical protein